MCNIAFSIPNEVLYDTKMNDSETEDFVRKAVALRYYTKAGVSLGYCAQIAGMSKGDFIRFLGENEISDPEVYLVTSYDNLEYHYQADDLNNAPVCSSIRGKKRECCGRYRFKRHN